MALSQYISKTDLAKPKDKRIPAWRKALDRRAASWSKSHAKGNLVRGRVGDSAVIIAAEKGAFGDELHNLGHHYLSRKFRLEAASLYRTAAKYATDAEMKKDLLAEANRHTRLAKAMKKTAIRGKPQKPLGRGQRHGPDGRFI